MAVSFERNMVIGLEPETAYNEAFDAAGHIGFRVLPGSRLEFKQDVRRMPSARGISMLSPFDIAKGLRGWSYECTMNLPKESLSHLLKHMFGTMSNALITTLYYKHVHTIKTPAFGTSPTPPSLRIRIIDDNREWQLRGGVLTELTLRMSLENWWHAQCRFIGGSFADAAIGTAPTVTTPSSGDHFFLSENITFTLAGSAWSAESFEITFKRNYADNALASYQAGSAERVRLESTSDAGPAIEISGFTRRLYDGITQFDMFDAFTEVTLIATGGTIDTEVYALKVDLQRCRVEDWKKEGVDGLEFQRLDFTAYAQSSSTIATDVVVTQQDTQNMTAI